MRDILKSLILGVPVYVELEEKVARVPSISDKDNTLFKSLALANIDKFVREMKLQNNILIGVFYYFGFIYLLYLYLYSN
jgi:hypothetical protein